MRFDHFDIGGFLRDHWQKKPLLIRNPYLSWRNPLEPDELAGLACEADVESRLIVQAGDDWKLEHGPFDEARFGRLGKTPWTLLVQAVDHHVPDVAELIDPFRFIPNWRIDDVMVSYAADGGGVGPHYDRYDVFLVQGLGRRRWRVGALCDERTALRPHDDLRLLAEFEATDEWILEPGDILYVPPGVAHDGVAVGDDCMTYSIGFRAPSRDDLLPYWFEHLLADRHDDERYEDRDLREQANPGEISAPAIARLHAMVTAKLSDRDAFARWFGQHNSAPKRPEVDWSPEEPMRGETMRERLADAAPLSRNPASRFSFVRRDANLLWLFVDGDCHECVGEAIAVAERICAQDHIELGSDVLSSEPTMELMLKLLNQGSVAFDREDQE